MLIACPDYAFVVLSVGVRCKFTMSEVKSYFDGVASGYQSASRGGVWSFVRDQERRALVKMLGPIAGRDVLELGCGAGYYTRLLLAEGARHVHAVDFSERMLAELPKHNVTPIHGDAATVDPRRTFDLMVSAGMLEFVPDAAAVLRNAARYAEPGAVLAILFPTNGLLGRAYRQFHRRNGMSIRLFDAGMIERMVQGTGWSVAERASAGPYSATVRLIRGAR